MKGTHEAQTQNIGLPRACLVLPVPVNLSVISFSIKISLFRVTWAQSRSFLKSPIEEYSVAIALHIERCTIADEDSNHTGPDE